MVFAEAEPNTLTDGLAAGSFLREHKRVPQKIELLERDKGPAPLKTVISATSVNVEEVVQFGISLISEIGKSGEEGSSVASEIFDESPGPMEKDELPSLLDLKLESEEAGNTGRCAFSTSRTRSKGLRLTIVYEEEPAEPTVSSIVMSNDSPETQPILSERTTAHPPNVTKTGAADKR
jgi:hypothetical protein